MEHCPEPRIKVAYILSVSTSFPDAVSKKNVKKMRIINSSYVAHVQL